MANVDYNLVLYYYYLFNSLVMCLSEYDTSRRLKPESPDFPEFRSDIASAMSFSDPGGDWGAYHVAFRAGIHDAFTNTSDVKVLTDSFDVLLEKYGLICRLEMGIETRFDSGSGTDSSDSPSLAPPQEGGVGTDTADLLAEITSSDSGSGSDGGTVS